ncbi:MAG: DNA polymerase IV [Peptostreptococcaceae bacterium]|nr:DNA polymerase IV [Peptostreptococcaceae bacterium]
MERVILHCDLNNFYASVECAVEPSLRGKPVAVCGDVEARQGIVLAKSQEAKKFGVQTAEPVWQAKRKCPNLIIVPPHFRLYSEYSGNVRKIYERYTDYVENFGLDECWLDVTGSQNLFGKGAVIANEIKETIKKEMNLTISVGVSFNKIFAKLGSDMKKPDAVTEIPKQNFREKIWGLPASELLGVGRSTSKKLESIGIRTIGQLAQSNPDILRHLLGKNGLALWEYANGRDESRVRHRDVKIFPKSIGHGATLPKDLTSKEEVWKVLFDLTQDVSARLRENQSKASKIQIAVKNNKLETVEFQTSLHYATRSSFEMAKAAMQLFEERYRWEQNIRALTVRAIALVGDEEAMQLNFFDGSSKHAVYEQVEKTIYEIRNRFGQQAVSYASLMEEGKVTSPRESVLEVMPSAMYQ